METIYDVNYFIGKFEAIHEKRWMEKFLTDRTNGRKCVLGLCGVTSNNEYNGFFGYVHTEESRALIQLLTPLSATIKNGTIANQINDGLVNEYQQGTPKKRILAALYDIKKMQEEQVGKQSPAYPDLTKQIANLPIQEEVSDKMLMVKEIQS